MQLGLAVLLRDEETLVTNLDDLMFLLEGEPELCLVPDSEVCWSAGLDDLHTLPPLPAQPRHAGPAGNVQDLKLSLAGWRQLQLPSRVDWDQARGRSGGPAGQQHRLVGPQLGERPGNLDVNRRLVWWRRNLNDVLLGGLLG